MKRICSILVPALLAMTLALPLGAQAKHIPLKKSDGSTIKGKLVEDAGDFIKVRVGTKTESIPYAQLHGETIFYLRSARTPKDDANAQLELGEYALKNDLFHAARQAFFNAALAKDDEATREKALNGKKRADAAQCRSLLKVALEAKKNGNYQLESIALSHLVTTFPGSPECRKAEKMLAEMKVGSEANDVLQRLDGRLKKEVENARKAFDKAIEENQKGLEASSKKSKAERHFEHAVKNLKKCVKAIAHVREKYQQDREILERVAEADKKVKNLQIEVLINLSHLYSSRQSLKKAMDYANEAIAIDPKSSLARQTRNHIELMMSYDSRGWRR